MAVMSLSAFSAVPEGLAERFSNPVSESRPRVWWHWMNGNVTKEGIRKDLLWMHQSGIGGFTVFDAGMATPQVVAKRLEYMTPEWKDALSYALMLADSLGLEVTIPSSPGWSLMGGAWVTPEDAMKKLTWREMEVTGTGKMQTVTLPDGFATTGPFQNKRIEPNLLLGEVIPDDLPSCYHDIKVLAFPMGEDERSLADMPAVATCQGKAVELEKLVDDDLTTGVKLPIDAATGKATLDITFPEPVEISALSLSDGRVRLEFDAVAAAVPCRLYVADEEGEWQQVCGIPSGGAALQTLSFKPVRGQSFRLEIDKPAIDPMLAMMGYPVSEPTEVELSAFNLFNSPRVNHAEEKTGFMASHDITLFPTPADAKGIEAGLVIDLTDKVDAQGVLHWQAPKGKWRVLRLGWSLTGKRNHPASPEATGLEIDKLDKDVWRRYFNHYLGMYDVKGSKAIRYILTDSYESGTTTWSNRMAEEFKARRGYDLTPWMPVLAGYVVQSGEASDRFLWDWRRTIAELTAENYDLLTEIAKAHGMDGRYTESHEHGRLYVADGMEVKRTSRFPMAAFWARQANLAPVEDAMAAADIRESASVAHLYGQNIVAAESFTVVGFPNNAWTFSPESLKPYADHAFAHGVNRIVVHTSPHQPVDSLRPGVSLSAVGQWFDRHETWAGDAGVWTDYLARTCYMLQQGRPVADILYYYGEDNNISALFGHVPPTIPAGYNYDYVNADALLHVVDASEGRMTTPSGMEYAILVLDDNARRMSLPVLRKMARLAEQGVVICGAVPEVPVSLTDDEAEFRRLVQSVWHSGRTNVHAGANVGDVLADMKLLADVQLKSTGGMSPRFVHRKAGQTEIYWISNPENQAVKVEASLRVSGIRPMLYNPENGEVKSISFVCGKGRTEVTLDMDSHGAEFVVFEEPTDATSLVLPKTEKREMETATLGAWKLDFVSGPNAPASRVTELKSLTEMEGDSVKYFSGTMAYTTTLVLKAVPKKSRIVLDLGDVKNIASVEVNGRKVGTWWKSPFECDITDFVRKGRNELVVKVTDLWANRLIGDVQPGAQPCTFITLPFYMANAPLLPSGLIGPVRVWNVSSEQ